MLFMKVIISFIKVKFPIDIENANANPMSSSMNNKNIFSKSSLNVLETMTTEKNFDPANQASNNFITNTYTLIDSEFLKKSLGENLTKLKSK